MRRRWPWLSRTGVFGAGSTATGSSYITNIQGCLANALGPWVPQSGFLDGITRSAIRAFQTVQQMPPTGVLDRATSDAIQAACQSQAPLSAPPAGAQPGSDATTPTGPEPDASPDASSGPDAAPVSGQDANANDGAADASEPGPPDGGEGGTGDASSEMGAYAELERDNEGEHELVVGSNASIKAKTMSRLPLTDGSPGTGSRLSLLPNGPGVYVIYVGHNPWYVGVAEEGVRNRFLSRLKVIRDLGLDGSVLKGRSVQPILLQSATGTVSRRSPAGPSRSLPRIAGLLRILEQHYINKLGTRRKGNATSEGVVVTAPASVSIEIDGRRESLAQEPTGSA